MDILGYLVNNVSCLVDSDRLARGLFHEHDQFVCSQIFIFILVKLVEQLPDLNNELLF